MRLHYMSAPGIANVVLRAQLPSSLLEEHHALVLELFDWLVQPCLDYVRLHCKTLLSSSPSHLVVMLIRLYHCLLQRIMTSTHNTETGETMTNSQVGYLWALCHRLH